MSIKESHLTLHRYYIWANRMRTHLTDLLEQKPFTERHEIEARMYQGIWYGLLHAVIEGWNRLKRTDKMIVDERIDQLLTDKKKVKMLADFRNGVFHFHPEYVSAKLKPALKNQVELYTWARTLGLEFGRFLLDPSLRPPKGTGLL